MKKLFLCFCLILALTLLSALPAAACWNAPEPLEIFSEDGNRVFVFIPDEDSMTNAYAAVYEITDGKRQVVYIVEDLSSFAFESNFHFSSDMTHFARTFNPSGIPVFEAFSNGLRTRVVNRNDFIEDYASIEAETSIGPMYTIRWRIEEHSPYADTITISTDEGKTLIFDLSTALFHTEDALPAEAPIVPVPLPETLPLPVEPTEDTLPVEPLSGVTSAPTPEPQPSRTGIYSIAGIATALIGGVLLIVKRKKAK